ncbi:MAG: repeat-containing protein [Bacteroidetes bacterium]|nr:repeat-containing protein [Bacteroidota bacterium]
MFFMTLRVLPCLSAASLLLASGCTPDTPPSRPRPFLAITHSALNRLSFFDLDRRLTVGVLPTMKLPHDMVLDPDSMTLFVVCSGSQNISTYSLRSPALWEEARDFMSRDSSAQRPPTGRNPMAMGHPGAGRPADSGATPAHPESANPDPVHLLLPATVRHSLTDPAFPEKAAVPHARVNASTHTSCFDCHQRSVGAKPFAPRFSSDSSGLYIVHLAGKNLNLLDSKTRSVVRTIPLTLEGDFAPIEAWVDPAETIAVVTFRAEIGQSKPGRIGVFDLRTGSLRAAIPAGVYPWHLLPTGQGRRFYVNNFQSSRISIFDLDRMEIVDSIVVENGPAMMVRVPERDLLLVSCFYTDRVLAVNTSTNHVERRFDVDANPTSIEPGPDGDSFFVLCGGESSLLEISLTRGTTVARYPLLFGAYAMHPFQLENAPGSASRISG